MKFSAVTGTALHGPSCTANPILRGPDRGSPSPRNQRLCQAMLALPVLAACRRSCGGSMRSMTRKGRVRCKSQNSDSQVDRLQQEAAKLKAEVEELKREKEERRRQEEEVLFRIFDTDGSGAVDAQELQKGLKDLWGIEVEESTVARLLEAQDANSDGILQPDEFDLKKMEANYQKMKNEERSKELAMREQMRDKQEKERADEEKEEYLQTYLATLPESNEDTGPLARFGSAAAYILPLLDSFRFSAAVAREIPQLKPLILTLKPEVQFLDQFSYGLAPLLLFIVFQNIANNTELPKLLRYNMRQAVLLTLLLFVPGIVGAMVTFVGSLTLGTYNEWGDWSPGKIPTDISDPFKTLVFISTLACTSYAMVSSVLGIYPKGIPFISAEAERTMAPTRDTEVEARLRKQLGEAEKKSKEKEPTEKQK
eukprot:CAMPEP_0197626260 /NCGR_PEP_ID=MMETSP1338-20131121/5310_1 /TAXON_ID=43686 ORGANISM="Pelagodinium beii, Strain RCC1491" /NCGR_SAMPLE_ID=MMETSP1338 /ASSEMBLY_ACC=CAM_ASM_000754 /LENGTH=424 /DNA_ID=CAMNT_0043196785 /DNA_START=16 /DNA_END=1290 /DNA_ORIENTATION=-